MFTLANLTEPTITSTTEKNNVGTIVGVTVGFGTIFLIIVVITTFLVYYFCRFKKKVDASTATLMPIELDGEKISLSKKKNIQSLNVDVVVENSSYIN